MSAEAAADADTARQHYRQVIRWLQRGTVTPVLGAGASALGQLDPESEDLPDEHPPSTKQLAAYLAKVFEYPTSEPGDLLRVAQWVSTMGGSGDLYDELHDVFIKDYEHTPLHDFLATAPGQLRGKGLLKKPPLIITTNYDNLMESALEAAGEPFDLVVYKAEGLFEGKFCLRRPDGELELIDPDKLDINPDKKTVLLKIHGFVNRHNPNHDSYVITEDHYIDYLTRTDLNERLPTTVVGRLKNCHFLFLGYSLRDWNMRAILSRLYSERVNNRAWWAVQLSPDALERKSLERWRITMLDLPLDTYVSELSARLADLLRDHAQPVA